MAKVTLDLNQFKASGVYTVEFDSTESVTLNTQTIRLVVGFSKKGPINAPVFLRDIKGARKVFGNIDTSLEKNGSFFHRSIETALQTGPIYALNLRALENTPEGDMVEYQSMSIDTAEQNSIEQEDLLVSFYNNERFWRPDTDYFHAVVNNSSATRGKLLSLVNINSTPISVFVIKSDIKGFDVTAREYYGQGNVPSFIRDFDFIADYFLEVTMVQGDWTNYDSLSIDPVYSQWFDKNGLKADQYQNFLNAEETTSIGTFVGTIIPDFVDGNGVNQYLETIINNAVGVTGIYMTIDRGALEDTYDTSSSLVDLIGHNLVGTTIEAIDFISYSSPITEALTGGSTALDVDNIVFKDDQQTWLMSVPYGGDRDYFSNVLVIKKPAPADTVFTVQDYDALYENLSSISIIKTPGLIGDLTDYVKVETVTNTGTELHISYSHPDKDTLSTDNGRGQATVTSIDGNQLVLGTATGLDHSTLVEGDLLYSATLNTYFIVESAAGTPGGVTIKTTIPVEGDLADSIYGYTYYDKWSSSISVALTNTLINTTIEYLGLANGEIHIAETNLVQGTPGTQEIDYVLSPALILDDQTSATDSFTTVYPGNSIAEKIDSNSIIDGDRIYADNTGTDIWYIAITKTPIAYGLQGFEVRQYADSTLSTQMNTTDFVLLDAYYYSDGTLVSGDVDLVYYSSYGNIENVVPTVENSVAGDRLSFKIAAVDSTDIEVGHFLVTEDLATNPAHLTKVTNKLKTVNQITGDTEYIIQTNERIGVVEVGSPAVKSVTRYLPIEDFVTHYQPSALNGFTLSSYHLPDGTVTQQEKIYEVITDTGLFGALADQEQIGYRYIVDTFEGCIAPNMGPKIVLTTLAKARQQCMAFINTPSVKQFSSSTDPRFTDVPDPAAGYPKPVFQSHYIPTGGNLSLGPSFRFTLPTEEQGSKYMGAFTPNLLIRENNRNLSIPPAADASNNFVAKFINGQPYSITAGPRRGIISAPNLVGVEYEYTTADREELEPFGLNPIINTRNTGPMIYSNSTAFQKYRSAFNNLHVRDLLITVEENIEQILSFYIWEFNDARTRLEIKTLVDRYLSVVQNGGGIYDFLTIMDETNNPPEVIDQNIGIIDVGIEPARGLQKIINRVTVLKTGTISSGGFTIA